MHYNHIKHIQTMTLRGLEGRFKSISKFIEQFSTLTSCVHKTYHSDNVDTSNKVGQTEYKRETRDKDM